MSSNQVTSTDPTVAQLQRSYTNSASLAYNQLVSTLAQVQADPSSVTPQELSLLASTVGSATSSLQQAMSSIATQIQSGGGSTTLQAAYQQANDLLQNIGSSVGRLNNAFYSGGSNLRITGNAQTGYNATTVNTGDGGSGSVAQSVGSLMSQGITAGGTTGGISTNASAVAALQGTPVGNILSAVVNGLVAQVQSGQLNPVTGQMTSTGTTSGAGGTGNTGSTGGASATSSGTGGWNQALYAQNEARNTESGGVAANPLLQSFFSFLTKYLADQQQGGGSSNTKSNGKTKGGTNSTGGSNAGGAGGAGDVSSTGGTQNTTGTTQQNTTQQNTTGGTQQQTTGTQQQTSGTQNTTGGTQQNTTGGTQQQTYVSPNIANPGGGSYINASGTGGAGTTGNNTTGGTTGTTSGTAGNTTGTGGTTGTTSGTAGTGGTGGDTVSPTDGDGINAAGLGQGSGVDNSGALGNPLMGAANINGYILAVLLECYNAGQKDLLTEAQNLQALNRAKDGVRAQLASARTQNSTAQDPGGGNSAQVQNLEDQLTSMGDDAQLEQLNLQNLAQNQQQLLQMISNFMKNTHDDSMAIIRHIGGG